MSEQGKWFLAVTAACLLTLPAPHAENGFAAAGDTGGADLTLQAQVNLHEVDLDLSRQGSPAVTLTADGPVTVESFLLEGPERLVLDLTGVVSQLAQYRYEVNSGGVAGVRAGQHKVAPVPVTRVVFDLDRRLPYRIIEQGSQLTVVFGDAATDSVPAASALQPPPVADPALDQVLEDLEARGLALDPPDSEPAAAPSDPAATPVAGGSRAVEPDVIERLLSQPAFAAPEPQAEAEVTTVSGFETRRIVTDAVNYTGKRISLNLVDADIKQVFRLFHEISGLNFVLDPDVGGRVTIVLDQVPWDQALDIILKNNGLDKTLENNVLRIASTTKLAQEAAARRQLRDAKELEVEATTLTRTLSYAKAIDVERVIQNGGILSSRGRVIVDERTNTLIISDVPKKVEPIDALISTLDAETPQVMIEARIVETSRSYVRDLGVVWGVDAIADASRGTSTGLSFPHNASARYGLNLPGDGGASNLGFSLSNVVDSFTLDVQLNALEREGHSRILSSPKVATQNNERAEIEQGVRIPIVNTTATEINVEFVSASLRLVVTPQITAEGTIILDVEVENNSPDFVNTSGEIPSIRTQRAQTKVLINDGGTTVIGGIFTVNEGRSEEGTPWFRKIPIFGWLFRSENVTQENRELLIFITPKIVRLT